MALRLLLKHLHPVLYGSIYCSLITLPLADIPKKGGKILYNLKKLRNDLGTSPLFTCQYSPDEWGNQLSDEKECYGKLDGIRRRLTTGFTVLIEKA